MTRHLLLVTIGPVQDFIASARRTRDLWFGSHLLSELSRKVSSALVNRGASLVFPAIVLGDSELENCLSPIRLTGPDKDTPPLNIANKVLAEVPEGTDPRVIADTARKALADYWRDTASDVKSKCEGLIVPGRDIDEVWAEQIETLIELSAAWAAIDEAGGGYKKARDQVEKAIAARKNLRDFEPWKKQRGDVPKSSLDGARDTVLRVPDQRAKGLARKYRIADGEQLDAVGLVKRAGGEPDQFVPIVNVALASWIALADGAPEVAGNLQDLRNACIKRGIAGVDRKDLPCAAPFQFDASIFLPSRWRPTFEEQGLGTPQDADAWGNKNVRPLLGKLSEPYPYVACLVADGDHMGGAIDLMTDAESHRTFSRKLASFATEARRIVEQEHLGSLVYSGGDDVLAFVPLPEALGCADALRRCFVRIMETACAAIKDKDGYKQPTLSVGIGIGHVMEGMGDLLALGRRAEKLAKGGDLPKGQDRNALAILLDKRSGGTRSWRAQWSEWDEDPAGRLRLHAEAFSGMLSRRKVYEIARTLVRLPDAKTLAGANRQSWMRVLRMEVCRSLARMEAGGGVVGAGGCADIAEKLGLPLDEPADYAKLHGDVASWVDRVLIAAVIAEAVPRLRDRAKEKA